MSEVVVALIHIVELLVVYAVGLLVGTLLERKRHERKLEARIFERLQELAASDKWPEEV